MSIERQSDRLLGNLENKRIIAFTEFKLNLVNDVLYVSPCSVDKSLHYNKDYFLARDWMMKLPVQGKLRNKKITHPDPFKRHAIFL